MCVVAIDFDDTISADFDSAKIAIDELRNAGHVVVIWSSRNNRRQHGSNRDRLYMQMIQLLSANNIKYDEIDDGTCGKFHAQVYIDDKARRFTGDNWHEILNSIY